MDQCPHCGSFNDRHATFCNQCGGRLEATTLGSRSESLRPPLTRASRVTTTRRRVNRRGWVGALLVAVLLALLAVVVVVVQQGGEPKKPVAQPVPTPGVEPREEDPPAKDEEATPSPVLVELPRPERASEATVRKRVSMLVSQALVILELRDDETRVTEQRGVLVDESGVVLCRFRPLIGAWDGAARLLTAEGVRTDILGLSFRDEASDLALLRLAPVKDGFPWLPLASEETSSALVAGDELYVFNDYRALPVAIDTKNHLGPDGVRRLLLGETSESVKLPPEVFLVADPSARVIGLCRSEKPPPPPTEEEPAVVDLFHITVDAAASLKASLHLPVGLTLRDLAERLYVGTFPDLYKRGRRAYRARQWKTAIELFEGALERVALDAPAEEEILDVTTSLRESYLREVDRLAKARRYRESVVLAESAVARYEDDPVLWRLLGEARLALDENADGIVALLESRSLEPNRSVEEALKEAYLKVAAEQVRVGEERGAELSLLEGIEVLPSSGELYVELARLYIRFEAYDDAVRLLDRARELDPTLAGEIDALLAKIEDALKRRDAVIIPLTSANSIRTKALIYGPEGQLELEFIVDTGATFTAVNQSIAESLGYDIRRADRVTVRTANGLVTVPLLPIQSLSLEGYTVRNLKVLVLPDSISPGVRLLGLNFLNHFKYTVDAQRREFRLERP